MQTFKSEDLFYRIVKMLYAAGYSEIYGDEGWRNYAFEEFNKLVSVGDSLPRTLNCGGRLFLCFAIKWLVNKGIVEDSDKLRDRINRLFYRNELIWDCNPDMISPIDNDIDGEGVVMLSLFEERDTLERYALQEKMIIHLNELDRILCGDSEFVDLQSINPLMLCSMLHFVKKCDEKSIFPLRTSNLLIRIRNLWDGLERERWHNIIFDYICMNNSLTEELIRQMTEISQSNGKVGMFLFLHNMPDIYRKMVPSQLSSPDEVHEDPGKRCCELAVMLDEYKH